MIILFSFSLGMMMANYKKRQLDYIDSVLYMCRKIRVLLKSVSADTDSIMCALKKEDRLEGFDFDNTQNMLKNSPLASSENTMICDLLSSIGKYDLESQLKIIDEFEGNFKLLKNDYQSYYNSHKKLYLSVSLLCGALIAVLLA